MVASGRCEEYVLYSQRCVWIVINHFTFPIVNTDERSSPTNENRAGVNRWISERRAALETAVDYWRAKHGENEKEPFHGIKGQVVWAGLEPLAFKALFPDWTERPDVREINEEVSWEAANQMQYNYCFCSPCRMGELMLPYRSPQCWHK